MRRERGPRKDRGPGFSAVELRRANLDRLIAAETQTAQIIRENEWLWSEVHRLDRKYDRLVEIIKQANAIRSTGAVASPTCTGAPHARSAETSTGTVGSKETTTSSVATSVDSSDQHESFLNSNRKVVRCYCGGNPGEFEGPLRDCPVHGENV